MSTRNDWKSMNVRLTEKQAEVCGVRWCRNCRIVRNVEGGMFMKVGGAPNVRQQWCCAGCYQKWIQGMRKRAIREAQLNIKLRKEREQCS